MENFLSPQHPLMWLFLRGFHRYGVYRIWPQSYENPKIEIFSYTVDNGTMFWDGNCSASSYVDYVFFKWTVAIFGTLWKNVTVSGWHIQHVHRVCVCVTVNLLSHKLRKIQSVTHILQDSVLLRKVWWHNTEMRRLTMGIRSEKCVVRRFLRCANVYLHKPR